MRANELSTLPQRWDPPTDPRPIVVIGAGSIVRDAHLPVYARLGFHVEGIFDVNPDASKARAEGFGIPRVFTSLDQAIAQREVIFDLAVPPTAVYEIAEVLPRGAPVLIQKPLGRDLVDAERICRVSRDRNLRAAVNFQLRFSPNMIAMRHAIERGWIGEITDVEGRVVVHTPWHHFDFLKKVERLEVLLHSIHYLDFVRLLLGEPAGVHCRAVRHPDLLEYPDTGSTIILDYGDRIRCSVMANHTHRFGSRHQQSQIKVEGTRGAAIALMGVNLDYPDGKPDQLWLSGEEGGWQEVPLRGSWFIEAFEGPISNLQRFVSGEDPKLLSPVEDALRTMALVEACYTSSGSGATPIPPVD
jgi:predicted dehydrogenase